MALTVLIDELMAINGTKVKANELRHKAMSYERRKKVKQEIEA